MTDLVTSQVKSVLDAYAAHDLAGGDDGLEGRRGSRRHLTLAVPPNF
jgi:hypothetical protein